jgi:heme-degrading monooxygenase HmoA
MLDEPGPGRPDLATEANTVSRENQMIARVWRGQATPSKADAYYRHFTTNVVPHLKELGGHKGAYLLRRVANGQVEFMAVTLWESMATIKGFAGPNPDMAVVEREARAVLSTFDDFVRHYEVAYDGT